MTTQATLQKGTAHERRGYCLQTENTNIIPIKRETPTQKVVQQKQNTGQKYGKRTNNKPQTNHPDVITYRQTKTISKIQTTCTNR